MLICIIYILIEVLILYAQRKMIPVTFTNWLNLQIDCVKQRQTRWQTKIQIYEHIMTS